MPNFNFDPLSNENDPSGRAREGQSRSAQNYGQLAQNYGQIVEHGVFGDEGISNIARGKGRAIALRRQALRKRLKNSIFRRLGPRAGGSADLIAANRIEAPAFAQMQEFMQNLRRQNELSKSTIGLAGRERAINALNNLYLQNRSLDLQSRGLDIKENAGGGGILDWVKSIGNILNTVSTALDKADSSNKNNDGGTTPTGDYPDYSGTYA